MAERDWPHRFRVSIRTNSGVTVAYHAVTWLSQEKAVAIAVMAHIGRHEPGSGPMGIHDVAVVDTGPVARAERGAMVLERTDLMDRMEF